MNHEGTPRLIVTRAENFLSMSTDESIGITFCAWTIIPWAGFI